MNSKVILKWNIVTSESVAEALKERFLQRFANRINSLGEVVIACQIYRDQGRNVASSLEKLKQLIELVAKPEKQRKQTKPTGASVHKRLKQKKMNKEIKKNRQKPDY